MGGQAGTSFSETRITEILQEAIDELEYCMGTPSTKCDALRANTAILCLQDQFHRNWKRRLVQQHLPIPPQLPVQRPPSRLPSRDLISTACNENVGYNITIPPGGTLGHAPLQRAALLP